MHIFDSHAHFDDHAFDEDRQELLKQIHAEGVDFIANIGCDRQTNENAVQLAEQYDFIYGAVGIHPESAAELNDENFELHDAASIIGRDPALTILLLKMVNRMTVNSGITTIKHAAAMLGQKELRKWINTAVVNELYADKPNEITRLSLLRAKFAENLAESYHMQDAADELFLMGLFSVLDVILEKTMEEALELVKVSDTIRSALIQREGKFAPIYDMMEQYENANWQEVSRQLIVNDIDVETISGAYNNALNWYKELTSGKK